MTTEKEKDLLLRYHGKTFMSLVLDLEERLELVEYWINQLSTLLIGPTSTFRLNEKREL